MEYNLHNYMLKLLCYCSKLKAIVLMSPQNNLIIYMGVECTILCPHVAHSPEQTKWLEKVFCILILKCQFTVNTANKEEPPLSKTKQEV